MPDRWSKANDTYEPVQGRVVDVNGPRDLTDLESLRFLAEANVNGTIFIMDSNVEGHGTCVNVELDDGPGEDIEFEWPVDSAIFITVPANRGVWKFEPGDDAVRQPSLEDAPYVMEVEGTYADGKRITFPSKRVLNPTWQLDADIA